MILRKTKALVRGLVRLLEIGMLDVNIDHLGFMPNSGCERVERIIIDWLDKYLCNVYRGYGIRYEIKVAIQLDYGTRVQVLSISRDERHVFNHGISFHRVSLYAMFFTRGKPKALVGLRLQYYSWFIIV
jgi:hypothetical protein